MTKQRKAQILTAALIGGLGFFVVMGKKPADIVPAEIAAPVPKADPTPQDAIYAMLDAAREGNVSAYLGYYTGQMEQALKQSMAEQGEAAFAKYLRETNAPIKGIAIAEPKQLTQDTVQARVEYVYQDRNEVQQFYLERTGKYWKIARLDSAERIKTLVPYGTPVQ